MKEYVKPEAEVVLFASEAITDAITNTSIGDSSDI